MEIHSLRMLIIHLSTPSLSCVELREALERAYPQVYQGWFEVALHDLQQEGLLLRHIVAGMWMFTAVESTADGGWPEYSEAFAERILAIEQGEFVKIDADDLITELDAMIQKAKARKAQIRNRGARTIKDAARCPKP